MMFLMMVILLLAQMRKLNLNLHCLRLNSIQLTFNSASSTASVTASILEYRHIQGRTYHSDRHPTEYYGPNDEQQLESIDITYELPPVPRIVALLT